ncbi:hypothetical protein NKH77_49140 [Streptomyces sp. M19]
MLTNDAGHDVHVHITNYQDRYYGGAAMIRLYAFDLVRNVIDVETFSPWFLDRDPGRRTPLEAETIELTGPADRFSLDVDFAARFGGFDPVVPPPARPPPGSCRRARWPTGASTPPGSRAPVRPGPRWPPGRWRATCRDTATTCASRCCTTARSRR